MNTGESTVNLV